MKKPKIKPLNETELFDFLYHKKGHIKDLHPDSFTRKNLEHQESERRFNNLQYIILNEQLEFLPTHIHTPKLLEIENASNENSYYVAAENGLYKYIDMEKLTKRICSQTSIVSSDNLLHNLIKEKQILRVPSHCFSEENIIQQDFRFQSVIELVINNSYFNLNAPENFLTKFITKIPHIPWSTIEKELEKYKNKINIQKYKQHYIKNYTIYLKSKLKSKLNKQPENPVIS